MSYRVRNRPAHCTQNTQTNNNLHLSSIKLAHSNIKSIRNKTEDIASELSEYDIICISETKLNNSISSTSLLLNSYNKLIRKDRELNNGGGFIMYIKNKIHFKRRDDLENNHTENIWVEVQSLKNKFLLRLFYRPPNATTEYKYWDNLEDVIEKTSEENLDIIIMGDFNHDTLKANIHSPLLRTLTKFNLQNLITEPTRVTNASSICIDLIITYHYAIIKHNCFTSL